MKPSLKGFIVGLVGTFLLSSTTYAINPEDGWYGGLIIGASKTPSIYSQFYNPITKSYKQGTFTYKVLGDLGLDIGYRCAQFRVEGELLLNYNPYKQIEGQDIILKPKKNKNFSIKGQTYMGAIMANAFYDFFVPGGTTNWVPYVGLGIGYATVKRSNTLYFNSVEVPYSTFSESANAPAAQGVVGASYYLDDFFAISLDYRYFTTKKMITFNKKTEVNFVNITFSGSFN